MHFFILLLTLHRVNASNTHKTNVKQLNQIKVMSEVVMVPDYGQRSNSNFDPNLLLATMMNGGGGFGGNGNWLWVIFLFFLFPFMRNGMWGSNNGNDGGSNGLGSLGALVNNDAGRELLMQAINGNGSAIQNLANMVGTTTSNIQQAICGVENSITQLSGQVGMSGQQIINSVQQGNMQLASQLASCCCDIRTAVTEGNYQNQIATLQQTQTINSSIDGVRSAVTQGFCDTAYAFRDQTCQLGSAIQNSTQQIKDATATQTNAIIAKLDGMEKSALLDKLDAQRETISTLKTNANITAQNYATQQMIGAAVAPLSAALAEIKCAQPNTVTVPYYPFSITPNCGCNSGCNSNFSNQFFY